MPKFFVNERPDAETVLTGENARHIGRSLRMRAGEELTLCYQGTDYFGVIKGFTADTVTCEIRYSAPSESEPSLYLTLFQAVPKGDKLEFVVQKAVELGASRIVPVLTARCVSRPSPSDFEKKRQRLQKIAEQAAKQSGRGIIPEISGIVTIEQAAEQLSACQCPVICYEKGGAPMDKTGIEKASTAGLLVGSEGGFEPQEVELCISKGAKAVSLGKRILRCETAPVAALSIMMHLSGNM